MKELYWRGGVPLLIALVTFLIPPPAGLTGQNWHLFGIFFAMIVGFITRPFPMGAVCIIGLCLISITKTLTPSEILVGFSSNAIWLIVMAFFFSRAFLKTGLGKRIAYTILAKIGNHSLTVGYAFALSDLVLCLTTPSSAACGGLYFGAGYVPLKTWWSLGLLFSVIQLVVWIGIGSVWWKLLGFW